MEYKHNEKYTSDKIKKRSARFIIFSVKEVKEMKNENEELEELEVVYEEDVDISEACSQIAEVVGRIVDALTAAIGDCREAMAKIKIEEES